MDLPDSHRIARVPHYSGTLYASLSFGYRTITVCGGRFHVTSPRFDLAISRALQPPLCLATQRVWARPRSIASTRGITNLFSLPMGTKMFQFPTFAPLMNGGKQACRVAPFGYLRIKSYLPIPAAFRSLSRPSSPLRAKASTECPSFALSLSSLTADCSTLSAYIDNSTRFFRNDVSSPYYTCNLIIKYTL